MPAFQKRRHSERLNHLFIPTTVSPKKLHLSYRRYNSSGTIGVISCRQKLVFVRPVLQRTLTKLSLGKSNSFQRSCAANVGCSFNIISKVKESKVRSGFYIQTESVSELLNATNNKRSHAVRPIVNSVDFEDQRHTTMNNQDMTGKLVSENGKQDRCYNVVASHSAVSCLHLEETADKMPSAESDLVCSKTDCQSKLCSAACNNMNDSDGSVDQSVILNNENSLQTSKNVLVSQLRKAVGHPQTFCDAFSQFLLCSSRQSDAAKSKQNKSVNSKVQVYAKKGGYDQKNSVHCQSSQSETCCQIETNLNGDTCLDGVAAMSTTCLHDVKASILNVGTDNCNLISQNKVQGVENTSSMEQDLEDNLKVSITACENLFGSGNSVDRDGEQSLKTSKNVVILKKTGNIRSCSAELESDEQQTQHLMNQGASNGSAPQCENKTSLVKQNLLSSDNHNSGISDLNLASNESRMANKIKISSVAMDVEDVTTENSVQCQSSPPYKSSNHSFMISSDVSGNQAYRTSVSPVATPESTTESEDFSQSASSRLRLLKSCCRPVRIVVKRLSMEAIGALNNAKVEPVKSESSVCSSEPKTPKKKKVPTATLR